MSYEILNFAEAETLRNVEGNMCGANMRGADALPESQTTSRRKGTCRNLGDLIPALSRCRTKNATRLRLVSFQAAATAARHVFIAAARKLRCTRADVR